ncbi:MAG: zinc ribbon domain-containing protein [Gemmatimonadota bacterium]|nr:zinc ribbon domain-containing protein [Gemmatimonadota bacterium]MDH4350138.1 zinc ribbon domain-containing protein [Gemmatimonadota bacterium]MDH5196562.1 zinc ribbon domain-containing protein [Gemmatimonadota bacterium]
MPTYTYRCQDCGSAFERRMSISAYSSETTVPCPKCASERTERSFGTVNVLTGSRAGGSAAACAPSGFG